jgi:hypothetical protein
VFGKIIDFFANKAAAKKRQKQKAIDWRATLAKIEGDISGCKIFLETRDGIYLDSKNFVAGGDTRDVVSILVAASKTLGEPEPTEDNARELANKLGAILGRTLAFFMNKDKASSIAFYIQITA